MINIKNIQIKYDTTILNQCNITIPTGKITLIRGISGCGKTSLLYRIGMISNDKNFEYFYNGKKINDDVTFRKNYCSFVLQDNSLFDHYDVLGNLELYSSFTNQKLSKEQMDHILNLVNLNVPIHQPIDTLSGGERQRLAIACALCKNTPILILDEPTSFLDRQNECLIFNVLKRISLEEKKTIIIASHSEKAVGIADEIYEIAEKKLFETKHSEDLIDSTSNLSIYPFSRQFFISYIKFFYKKYTKQIFSIITILTVFLIITNLCLMWADVKAKNSIISFQKLCENQLLITADKTDNTIDSDVTPFKLEISNNQITSYPYIKTICEMNGDYYIVVPFFEKNNIQSLILENYSDDIKCLMSYDAYASQMTSKINVKSCPISFYFLIDNQFVPDKNSNRQIDGVLKQSKPLPYFKSQTEFIYCDYSLLSSLYQKNNLDIENNSVGYIVFSDTYNDYMTLCENMLKTNYGIQLFFDDFETLNNLNRLNQVTHTLIITISSIFICISLIVLESNFENKRSKEMLMLKINGLSRHQQLLLSSVDTLSHCVISMFFLLSLFHYIYFLYKINVTKYLLISTMIISLSLVANLYLQKKNIYAISTEKVLRDLS